MTNLLPLKEGHYYHIYNRANGIENLFRKKRDYLHFLQLLEKYILPIADIFTWVLMPNHFHLLVCIKEDRVYKYSKEDFKKLISKNANTNANAERSAPADVFRLANKNNPTSKIIDWNDVKWKTIPLNSSASERPDDIKDIKDIKEKERPDDIKGPGDVKNKKPANPTRHFSHLCNAYAKYINEKYNRHGSLFQRPFRRKLVEDDHYLKQLVLYIHNNPVHHGFVGRSEDYLWSSYHGYLSSERSKLCKSETINWFGDLQNFITLHHQYAGNSGNMDQSDWLEKD